MTQPATPVNSQDPAVAFPDGFLWGAATAAHQVEGNNLASDWWAVEHSGSPVITEPSGDAVDHFHRWPEDLDLLAGLGLNAYRFSLEWSRIEPEPGLFSRASLDHYRRVIAGCLERGLAPVVTLQHVTMPRWFRQAGGWSGPDAAKLFARYAEFVLPAIKEGVDWVCTINEPNVQTVMTMLHNADPRSLNIWQGGPMPAPTDEEVADLVAAHKLGVEVVRSGSQAKAGWATAVSDVQYDDAGRQQAEEWFGAFEAPFLLAALGDDFVGVQTYFRTRFDANGMVAPQPGERRSDMWEFYPQALGGAVRAVSDHTNGQLPIIVTENGIPTSDDSLRIEYLETAIDSLGQAIAAGADVRGYMHWSALDNFEWALGYGPKFGLIECDRLTFERRLKPSAHRYAEIVAAARSR